MLLLTFIKGLTIGISIAAPVGPIGFLCINRTLLHGRISGLMTGLGAATADGIYGLIAGLGLTFISSFFLNYRTTIQLVGGIFLLLLGIKIILSRTISSTTSSTLKSNYFFSYISTFFLTLTNPITILSFTGIFAGLGIAYANLLTSLSLVLGVFLGSIMWWVILTTFVSYLQSRFSFNNLYWVNRVSGVIIVLFGLNAIIRLF